MNGVKLKIIIAFNAIILKLYVVLNLFWQIYLNFQWTGLKNIIIDESLESLLL